MSKIVDVIKNAPDFIGGAGVSEDEIRVAELALNIKFSNEYKIYLKEIGLASYDMHELTGICKQDRLDVIKVTKNARKNFPDLSDKYVVEETGIDGIVIWQDSSGAIYQAIPNLPIEKIANSLADYIETY